MSLLIQVYWTADDACVCVFFKDGFLQNTSSQIPLNKVGSYSGDVNNMQNLQTY